MLAADDGCRTRSSGVLRDYMVWAVPTCSLLAVGRGPRVRCRTGRGTGVGHMTDEVLTETRDGVLVVTINRPGGEERRQRGGRRGVAAALDELDANDDLRVGVLTGAGGTFCAGMDLKAFLHGRGPDRRGSRPGRGDPAAAAQAAGRGGRGLGAGRRLRDHARLRPGGGRRDGAVRRARGEARPGRRRGRGAAAARAGADADRARAAAHRRPDRRRARGRSSAWSTG